MRNIGFYNYYNIFNNNKMFDPNYNAVIGDDLLYPIHHLADVANNRGISISTIDTKSLDSYDDIIFFDYPGSNNKYFKELINMKFKNLYLFIFENEIIKPDNWNIDNYKHFKKVFTYNDSMVDNIKIFKFFLPNKLPDSISIIIDHKDKFCCMISGNKKNNLPNELYSERINAIRWFESNHPDCFDLYGVGWNLKSSNNILKFIYNKIFPYYISYKGEVASKREVLKKYKYSICYENVSDVPGYITEKIFDCFFAGCVPIYMGASNINKYIPDNTYIDKRKFNNYKELFEYLKNITDEEYIEYLKSINRYIKSKDILLFGADNFVDTILKL